ncbi:MAG: hypothetical protein IT249_04515 [Chitinophagaceae bacterium]|nr:hypothetical protein [Chitinophagaceae bacterium]
MLDKLGKGTVLREMISLFACFICLVMPLLGYTVYNKENALAQLWVRFMPVPESNYFSFALPALCAFNLSLCWPINGKNYSDEGIKLFAAIEKIKLSLRRIPRIGLFLMITGVVTFLFIEMVPTVLKFIVTLIYFTSFAGLMYVYFSPGFRNKTLLIILFAIFIVGNAIRSGMFTIVAYMGITIFSVLFIGQKTTLLKKVFMFLLGATSLLMIQSVKQAYRKVVWKENFAGNKAVLFANLMADRITSTENLISPDNFFPIYYRTNQGFNIALVMKRIPRVQPYDKGNRLAITFASSLVPRVLWPDKPEAGGKFNMEYYAGVKLRGWSTNVGPLGEAYGSFGVTGGIIFMFFLGAFIRWSYKMVFVVAQSVPLIILWIPVLFYQVTYSAESDTLQIFNSLFKSALFIWMLYKIFPSWFGVFRSQNQRNKTNSFAKKTFPSTQAAIE